MNTEILVWYALNFISILLKVILIIEESCCSDALSYSDGFLTRYNSFLIDSFKYITFIHTPIPTLPPSLNGVLPIPTLSIP